MVRLPQDMWVWQKSPQLGGLCVKAQPVDLHRRRVTLKCLLIVLWEQMGVGSGMGFLFPCSTNRKTKLML